MVAITCLMTVVSMAWYENWTVVLSKRQLMGHLKDVIIGGNLLRVLVISGNSFI